MYDRRNRCYNKRGSRTNFVHSSIPHCTYILHRAHFIAHTVRNCMCIGVYCRVIIWQIIVNWKAKLLSRHCWYPDPHSYIAPRKWDRSGSFRVSLLVVCGLMCFCGHWVHLSGYSHALVLPLATGANCGSRHRVSMFRTTAPSTVQLPVLSIVLSLSTGEVTRPRSSLIFVLAACTWIRKLMQPMS